MLSSFAQLRQQLHQSGPRSAVVAAAQDEHTLQAVLAARRDGLIHPILVGPPDQLRPLLDRLGASVPEEDLVPAGTEAECAARAVALIRQGRGRMLVKGMLPTRTLLRAVVDRETGIRTGEGSCPTWPCWRCPAYPKLIFDTDGGHGRGPRPGGEAGTFWTTPCQLCRFLGYDCPKAAVLCAAETVIPQHAGDPGRRRPKGRGPDRATSAPAWWRAPSPWTWPPDPQAPAIERATHSPVAGDADILLVPLHRRGQRAGQGPVRPRRGPDGRGGHGGVGARRGQLPGGSRPRRNIAPSCICAPCPGGTAKEDAMLMAGG